MNKYRLCFEDMYNKSFEIELLSSNSIYKLDKFTTKFDNEEELLRYFNIKKKNNFLKVLIKDGIKQYPLIYSNGLSYIENSTYLNKKLLEEAHNNNFLNEFIKKYNNNDEIKIYLKLIKKSLKIIDKYSVGLISISNSFNYKNIIKGKDALYKKEMLLEHINYEYSKIDDNLCNVFNKIIYDDNNINYINLRNLIIFINNYQDNIVSVDEKKLVKRIKS